MRWKITPDGEPKDWDQKVLEAEPNRRLSYTWHSYEPEMAEMFGWSDQKLAELRQEKRSKVTCPLLEAGDVLVLRSP